MEGGYEPDTPAAIVYKATWPEQRVYRCTVSTLARTAKENQVTKTALITVGGFLGGQYERSKLYDPGFTHGYRVGERIVRLALTAFTARGAALAQALAEKLTGLGNRCMIAVPARLNLAVPTYENLGAWTGERFADCEGILFIGASGIAVRAIAPYVRDKFTDPAVVSVGWDRAVRGTAPLRTCGRSKRPCQDCGGDDRRQGGCVHCHGCKWKICRGSVGKGARFFP